MSNCKDCVTLSKNSGRSDNDPVFGDPKAAFMWPIKDSTGAYNQIDCSVPLTQIILDGLLNEPDPTKRVYPIQGLEDFDSPLPTIQEQTFASGNVQSLGAEVRGFVFTIPSTSSKYSAQLHNVGSCGEMGVIFMDDCENLKVNTKVEGFARPLKVARNTWNALLDWARAGANAQQTIISAKFDKSEKNKDHGLIVGGSYDADFEGAEGLLDVNITNIVASAAADTITFDAKEIYGSACDLNDVQGLVPADLTIIVNAVTTTITGLVRLLDGSWEATVSDDIILAELGTIELNKEGLGIVTEAFEVVA